MALVRSLITTYFAGDLSRDKCSHTVYHTIGTLPIIGTAPSYQSHADEVLAAFVGGTDDATFTSYVGRNVEVRCYDMADDRPRAEKAYAAHAPTGTGATANGPTELAVVLSFWCGRNITGLRGRLFMGPFSFETTTDGTPGKAPAGPLMASVLTVGHALFNIGGENVAHVLFHPKDTKSGHAKGSSSVVSHYSVPNSWGVVHSRAQRPTARLDLAP